MKIQFLGAAQTVTGSCHMIEVNGKRFAVDCGMHQGGSAIESRNENVEAYRPEEVDFFLITHAHIDHTGLLPMMVKHGFKGEIYCTVPTVDLLEVMLQDSAHIQEMEASFKNTKNSRKGLEQVEPLYTMDDALATLKHLRGMEYDRMFEPAPGIKVVFRDAGHILGSSFLEMQIMEEGKDKPVRFVFSGDLGRPDSLLMSDPDIPGETDYLFVESTYGNRNHKDEGSTLDELAEAISYSYRHGEKVIIPAFALERTQAILYSLNQLRREGRLPDIPVFLDSPLAIRTTEIFRKYPDYQDEETQALIAAGDDPLDLPNLRYTLSTAESQNINSYSGSAIVISASGMANAGRIRHHLKHNLWRAGASVVFVGYQAIGTPGRKIVDGAKSIRIMGEDITINAKIWTIGGFSSHAGQSEIMDWVGEFVKPHTKVFLIHGEEKAQEDLAALIKQKFAVDVFIPEYLEETTLEVDGKLVVETLPAPETVHRVDWELLLSDTESKMALLRRKLEEVSRRSWPEQVDARDRIVELNGELLALLSQL
ncbi:MAG: MBL fold metallo-hydrolase [Desulfovibrionaceae bacterium]|nr:MBL fold metallo-hydrolase [Desulfovibrionaceae bacterium]